MGQQFLAHWKVWLVVGVVAAVVFDVLGRVAGHEQLGLVLYVAVAFVALVFYTTGVVVRHRREKELLDARVRDEDHR